MSLANLINSNLEDTAIRIILDNYEEDPDKFSNEIEKIFFEKYGWQEMGKTIEEKVEILKKLISK